MATADTEHVGPIVAVAADSNEFAGLLRHASSVESMEWGIEFARRAEIRGESWILAADGPGPALATRAAMAASGDRNPRAMISTGFCGGLDPALKPCDVFVASRVRDLDHHRSFEALPVSAGTRHAEGELASQNRVASTAREKAELRRSGASVVEMEAAAVAAVAEKRHAPFYCVRVVSDGAAEDMPLDFNRLRDRDGRFSRRRVARAALLRPWSIAGLVRLANNCRKAANYLGDFLVDCRF
jgi:adenosylhomocysteine nucleosidase